MSQPPECWAFLVPGAALVTAGLAVAAALLACFCLYCSEQGEPDRSAAADTAFAAGALLVPAAGPALFVFTLCDGDSRPGTAWELAATVAAFLLVPTLLQALLAGGAALLACGAAVPGCSGGAAVGPAAAGMAAGALLALLLSAILAAAAFVCSFVLVVAVPAAKAQAAATARRLRGTVSDEGGAPSEASSEAEEQGAAVGV